MYVSIREAGYVGFLLSEVLSFGTTLTRWSSNLMVVIKVMINEVNSIAYIVAALQITNFFGSIIMLMAGKLCM